MEEICTIIPLHVLMDMPKEVIFELFGKEKVRPTISQKELGKKEREINLKNAFKTSENAVKLEKVLLIDDIYTTGVTMDEAAKALLRSGVKEVRFLVLCTGKTD